METVSCERSPEGKNTADEVCWVEMGIEAAKCKRPLHNAPQGSDETPVCLMHSKDANKGGELFEAFWREFEVILEAAGEGEAHFEGFFFPRLELAGRRFEAICRFDRATFVQDAKFSYASFTRDAFFTDATFTQKADFGTATFTQKANFSNATFTQKANFSNAGFTQDAFFSEAIFTQDAFFGSATFTSGANFSGAIFTQDAFFAGATFTQAASFSGATFTREANFRGAIFTQDADFSAGTFTQDAGFDGATFRQHAFFTSATFIQDAFFTKAIFTQHAVFTETTFTQDAFFTEATFNQDAIFDGATFTGDAQFTETRFSGVASWEGRQFLEGASFRSTKFDPQVAGMPSGVFSLASLSHPRKIIFDDVDLSRTLFHNCDVSEVWFTSSVRWAKRGSRGVAVFEESVPLEYARGLRRDGERDYRAIAQIYQQLKKNYDTRLDYWTANEFHFGEMEMKRLVTPAEGRLSGLRGWIHRWLSLTAWYRYASDYGNNYLKPMLWFLAVLLLFAVMFPLPGVGLRQTGASNAVGETYSTVWQRGSSVKQNLQGESRLVGKSMLVAVDMATFLRNPEYAPAYPWGRVLAIAETLLTSTLFGLFLLAIRRQFRR